MAHHDAHVTWERRDPEDVFLRQRYARSHQWSFDGGVAVPASSSPHVVPEPMSAADAVGPEEAFVASLSSCHMLFFLSLAAGDGFVVDRYEDHARGTLGRDGQGGLAMTRVVLRPRVSYQGDAPSADAEADLHHRAHDLCFLARSVHTPVVVEPAGTEPDAGAAPREGHAVGT